VSVKFPLCVITNPYYRKTCDLSSSVVKLLYGHLNVLIKNCRTNCLLWYESLWFVYKIQ